MKLLRANAYPLVSVITPSFNQASFISETIESVLNQDYPNIEHIVIDGGSTDGTIEILKKYSSRSANFRFVSKKDRGQSHAVNKGLNLARGEIIGWLNSDDTYLPGAVSKAVNSLIKNPGWAMVYGKANFTNKKNEPIRPYPVDSYSIGKLFEACIICQPAAFIKKKVFIDAGGVDENLYFCMDYDLWMKIANKYPIGYIDHNLATSRLHSEAKTVKDMNDIGFPEIFKVSTKNFGTVSNHWVWAFSVNNYNKGPFWLLKLLKSHEIFGPSPKLISSTLISNHTPTGEYRIDIKSDEMHPLYSLIIQSSSPIPSCYVFVNNKYLMKTRKRRNIVELQLPTILNKSTLEIRLVPDFKSLGGNFLVNQILPLSKEEYHFYCLLKEKGPSFIKEWLNKNRFPKPTFFKKT